MVIQGVATRRVSKITQSLCGLNFSQSQVSAICLKLDSEVHAGPACPAVPARRAWLNRPLEESYPYVLVDARYEKIRRDRKVESNDLLIAKCVNAQGKRDLLGVQVCHRENDTTWSDFFQHLVDRGL